METFHQNCCSSLSITLVLSSFPNTNAICLYVTIKKLMVMVCSLISWYKSHLGRETIHWGISFVILAFKQVYSGIFLINNWCMRVQGTIGKITPEQVELGDLRKQTVKASNQSSSMASAVVSASRSCPSWVLTLDSLNRLWLWICKLNNALPPWVVY